MAGATISQMRQLIVDTDAMMNGELRMKSLGSVTGTIPILVFRKLKTARMTNASHGQGRRIW
jgi:hypothetical protein